MLKDLHIANYALIRQLDIDFRDGFSVLTGETGAGKSIILGALALVMGARADSKSITEGEERCVIEATFVSDEGELIIRRELNQNGRSRSFVNDEIVTQAELKALANRLIDIHSQHENLLIESDDFQLGIVDAIANNNTERERYIRAYEDYCQAQRAVNELLETAKNSKADEDYLSFQYTQLAEANLQDNEDTELEEEHYRLTHAEDIKQNVLATLAKLSSDEVGACALIHSCRIDSVSEELSARLTSVDIELKDIVGELNRIFDNLEFDPMRLQIVEERLDLLNTLMRKHQVKTVAELIGLRDQLQQQMQKIANFDEEIEALRAELKLKKEELTIQSQLLTESRKSVRESISKSLVENLSRLGIMHANVDIAIEPLEDFTPSGKDNVQFLFAANLNQSLRKVSEVASGGEIARIMLCIKALIASSKGLPTILFDEIDTGVSGDIATQMGKIMRQMASSRQIIAITHNPQIAVQADQQYLVFKQDENGQTQTHIRLLTTDERQQYIDQYYATISRAIASKDAK